MSQSNFVSNIPNNKLEPVFVGGGSGPTAKSSGTYVPAFLRNQNEPVHSSKTEVHTPEFKMTNDDFPSLLGTKPETKTNKDTPKIISHYSDALKKDIDKPKTKPKSGTWNGTSYNSNKKKQRILDDYESDDYDSDY
jgi:hypothetical protein